MAHLSESHPKKDPSIVTKHTLVRITPVLLGDAASGAKKATPCTSRVVSRRFPSMAAVRRSQVMSNPTKKPRVRLGLHVCLGCKGKVTVADNLNDADLTEELLESLRSWGYQ